MSTILDAVRRRIAGATFGAPAPRTPRLGVEAEFLALDAATHAVVPLEHRLVPSLQPLARERNWILERASKGAPRYALPAGGSVSFEPGGQLEYASPPAATPAELLADLRDVIPAILCAAAQAGITLVGAGIDPCNAIAAVPRQIHADRYRLMNEYFDAIGPAGARMMRQTASIQINVDATGDRLQTWSVLNAMAPYLVAAFANSRVYAGEDTGRASYRAVTWQALDSTRTGIVHDAADPIGAYVQFALDAPAMLVKAEGDAYLPLREWVARDAAPDDLITTHLTTLFPEIRPRAHFEVRSVDALPPAWLPAPVLLVAGIVMDEMALADAAALLGQPRPELLARAAASGLQDPGIASIAGDLADIALAGCARLGAAVAPADCELARDYFGRTIRQGRNLDASTVSPVVATAA